MMATLFGRQCNFHRVMSHRAPIDKYCLDDGHLAAMIVPCSCTISCFCFLCAQIYMDLLSTSSSQQTAAGSTCASILQMLDREYSAGRLVKFKTTTPLVDLIRYIESTPCHSTSVHYCPSHGLLDEISTFIQKEAACGFLKLLFHK
jgi:hypothetical protein